MTKTAIISTFLGAKNDQILGWFGSYTVAMSDQLEDTNPLDELKEKVTEVLEILNRDNLPIIVPEGTEPTGSAADAEEAATS